MRPANLPAAETLAFVLEHLPSCPLSILEVGCGNGELALRLQALGHQVIALDSSTTAIQQARELGVDARIVHWPLFELETESLDVILFTRSLHHIHPLFRAVEHARALLRLGGLVLIEDFAFDEVSPAIIGWFYDILSLLNASKRLSLADEGFGRELLQGGGHLGTWRRHHDHDLSPWHVMLPALKLAFETIAETAAPYLYRYLCPLLEDNQDGHQIATHVLEMEKELGIITPGRLIGRRFAGRKASP